MICSLSDKQKAAVENLTRVLIKRNPGDMPASILKKLYDIGFQQLASTGKGEEYGVAFVHHAATILDKELSKDTGGEGEREIAKTLFGNDKFSPAEINKYTHENEIRALVGLKESVNLARTVTTFSDKETAAINTLLAKIKAAFPKAIKNKMFAREMFLNKPVDPIELRVMEGDYPVVRISAFSKGSKPEGTAPRQQNEYLIPEGSNFAEAIAYGNMADYSIRTVIRNKGKSFTELKAQLKSDQSLIKAFSAYTRETVTPEENPTSSESFNKYFDLFINDILYAASALESQYQGYYLTDLSELVEQMNPKQREAFTMYSRELGLSGELDILAIKPDGTFRVVDIKTSQYKMGNDTLKQYTLQVSAYAQVLAEVAGLKVEGKADIFYIQKDYRVVLQSVYDRGVTRSERRKVVVTSVERFEQDVLSREEIADKSAKYRARILEGYTVVDTPKLVDEEREDLTRRPSMLSPDSILQRMKRKEEERKKKGDLPMVYLSNEPQSTPESIQAGARELERMFPELKGRGIKIIPHFLSTTGGNFTADLITLAERSNEGVAYHEGWHRFSQLYLTKEEKTNLYQSVRKQAIDYTTREGKKINTKDATFKELEEFLAEEFRKYAMNPKAYKMPHRSIFKIIWDFLKSFLRFANRNGNSTYTELFKMLYKGNYYRGNYSTNNTFFESLNMFYRNSKQNGEGVLDDLTFLKYRDFSDSLLATYLRNESRTITDLLSRKGINIIYDTLRDSLEVRRDILFEEMDSGNTSEMVAQEWENLNKILGSEDYPDTFNDFMRAYYRTTQYDSLRLFVKSNLTRVNEELDKQARSAEEVDEEEGLDPKTAKKDPEFTPEGETKTQEMEWDRSGNEKSALEVAREALKDFFIGIPELNLEGRLLVGQQTTEFEVIGENGLPVYLNKTKAFNKTKEILEGRFTWEDIIEQLNNGDNYDRFPELQIIRDRILGNPALGIQGLFPRLYQLESEIEQSTNSTEKNAKMDEHSKLLGFLKHFAFVMSMPKVRYETLVVNMNVPYENSFEEFESSKKVDPIYTRENTESVINSIIYGFTRGFQASALAEQERRVNNGEGAFMSVFDAFAIAMGHDWKTQRDFGPDASLSFDQMIDKMNATASPSRNLIAEKLSMEKYLYDSELKIFHFNPYYVARHFPPTLFSDSVNMGTIKDFFETYGIHLNDTAYVKSEAAIRKVYAKLSAVSKNYLDYSSQIMANVAAKQSRGETVAKRDYSLQLLQVNKAIATEKSKPNWDMKELANLEFRKSDLQAKIRGTVRMGFPINPVDELLYIGQDLNVRKNDLYRTFAITMPTFIELANVEKQYKDNYSVGSMIVLDGTQYSYFLPNQLLILSKSLRNKVSSFEDFNKIPELRHLNPIVNPQYRNSWMIRNMFDKNGRKVPGMNIDFAVISQISTNDEQGNKVEKKLSDLTKGEKLGVDFLMGTREGTTEMRRNEASDTGYRMSLVREVDGNYEYMKPVTLGRSQFKDEDFLNQMRNYVQAATWKYVYDRDVEQYLDKGKDGRPLLGIFDSMLSPQLVSRIKDYIDEKAADFDWNTLIKDMETNNNSLFVDLSNGIADYFEDITFRNEDSFAKDFERLLPQSVKNLYLTLADTFRGRTVNGNVIQTSRAGIGSFSNLMRDEQFMRQMREYIANDFIMAMEDSLLFFGDYTLYKDPAKRRKVLTNNGSTAITDPIIANSERIQNEHNSLVSVYREARNLPRETGKDYQLIRKTVLQDKKLQSVYTKGGEKSRLAADLKDLYSQVFGMELTEKEIIERKKPTFNALDKMEMADAAAYISLDTLKRMMETEQMWLEKHTKEYNRQKLILKDKLAKKYGSQPITEEEQQFIDAGPYAGFNVAKYAMTGPVYATEHSTLKEVFDKMGLKVLLPETDWNNKQQLFEAMLEQNIDYYVYDSGSKIYKGRVHDVWDNKNNPKKVDITYVEHAGGFFKYQQNTSGIKDKATFARQLRGIFFEIMELHRLPDGTHNPELKRLYDNFLGSLQTYVAVSSEKGLAKLGLDKNGQFMKDNSGKVIGKKIFVEKIRQQLLEIGDVDLSVLDHLDVDTAGDFTTLLEALPLQREIFNVVSGILDDHFRNLRLNGTKFYQTPEIGTKIKKDKGQGTISLKWHGLIRDEDGNIIGVSPVECKIAFKSNFKPLLQLRHRDGQKIGVGTKAQALKRLNEMLRDEEWMAMNKDSVTFVGVRIPLQDMNFTSHMIVKEFLPESEGDSIIVPPEFYKQLGSDNDIDTITATFRYLNKRTGDVIPKVTESLEKINAQIERLENEQKRLAAEEEEVDVERDLEEELEQIKEQMLEENIFGNEGKSEDDLDAELTVTRNKATGVMEYEGMTKGGLLYKFQKEGLYPDIMLHLQDLIEDINLRQEEQDAAVATTRPSNELGDQIKLWKRRRNDYMKGLNNDITNNIIAFLRRPESFEYLTETDSMDDIEAISKKLISITTGRPVSEIGLNQTPPPIQSISQKNNLINHENNFQIRTMLGSYVKFRRLLTTISMLNSSLSQNYKAHSVDTLYQMNTSADAKDKVYQRRMWTPLLRNDVQGGRIPIKMYDEDGKRITKNMSMLISTLLDLFKNIETYPSLNITWNNVKPLILLVTQGVPLETAITFLNNPVTRMVEENRQAMGQEFQLRHAIAKTSEDLFGGAIHGDSLYSEDGGTTPNQMMRRHGKQGEKFLYEDRNYRPNTFKITPAQVEEFMRDFAKYRRDKNTFQPSDLKNYLNTPEGSKYKEFSKDIMAYYSTLVEDGDLFYQMVIRKLDRDATKYNSVSQIADAEKSNGALVNSGLMNSDFLSRIQEESVFSPFYNDKKTIAALQSLMPGLYREDLPEWNNAIMSTIRRLSSRVYGSSEDKRRVEQIIVADLIEFLYKNFYYLRIMKPDPKDPSKKRMVYNLIYDWFERDIIPEMGDKQLRSYVYRNQAAPNQVSITDNTATALKAKGVGENEEFLSGAALFTNQIEAFRAKYPELMELEIVKKLLPKRMQSYFKPPEPVNQRDEDEFDDATSTGYSEEEKSFMAIPEKKPPKQPPVTVSAVFNLFSQAYLSMNLPSSPQEKAIDEQLIRDEWRKLIDFKLSEFPTVWAKIINNRSRRDHYSKLRNVAEIKQFFRLMAYYSLAQSSHLNKIRGSFAYLAPQEILSDVIQKGLNNFFSHITEKKADGSTRSVFGRPEYERLLRDFERIFIEMNTELGFEVPERGEGYRKVQSGKLYSKFTLVNPIIKQIQAATISKIKAEGSTVDEEGKEVLPITGGNNFVIDMEGQSDDPFIEEICK